MSKVWSVLYRTKDTEKWVITCDNMTEEEANELIEWNMHTIMQEIYPLEYKKISEEVVYGIEGLTRNEIVSIVECINTTYESREGVEKHASEMMALFDRLIKENDITTRELNAIRFTKEQLDEMRRVYNAAYN